MAEIQTKTSRIDIDGETMPTHGSTNIAFHENNQKKQVVKRRDVQLR